MTKLYLDNGRLSAQGLRYGLTDTFSSVLSDGQTLIRARLTHNGSTYDVRCAHSGDSEWAATDNGGVVRAGWAQFNTLGEARAFIRSIPRLPNKRALWEQCALTVGYTLAPEDKD